MSEEKKGLRIVVPKMVQQTKVYIGDEDVTDRLLPKSISIDTLTAESGMSRVHLECYADEIVLEDARSSLKYVEKSIGDERITDERAAPTVNDVRNALRELHKHKGANIVLELLQDCDANTVSQLDEDHYGWIIDEAGKELKKDPDKLTPEQIGIAQSLLVRRKELESTINMIEQFKIPDGGAKHLFAIKVHSGGHESRLNMLGADIVNYLTMELNDNLSRLEQLGVCV